MKAFDKTNTMIQAFLKSDHLFAELLPFEVLTKMRQKKCIFFKFQRGITLHREVRLEKELHHCVCLVTTFLMIYNN